MNASEPDPTQEDATRAIERGERDTDEGAACGDRRTFLKRSIKAAAFVAPVVMFFKPSEAMAGSGGSAITPGP